jgi:arginyl-tRNA--protein-N-Asp/Glu arginylyltransferase
MFAQSKFPLALLPGELDAFLEKGWFRMGQTIFTTSFLNFKGTFYNALWLRIKLDEHTPGNSQVRLLKQNDKFRYEIAPFELTDEKESLYAKYKSSIAFEPSSSLHQLMYGSALHNIYNSFNINLYDGAKLIGSGIFDVGEKSAAGITSFYDPAYKKYSLGKYLIFLKIQFCKSKGFEFFYPGYFVPGYKFFNYKLDLSKNAMYYLDVRQNKWMHIHRSVTHTLLLESMKAHLQLLLGELQALGIDALTLQYEYFDANILIHTDHVFLDFPVFLSYQESHDSIFTIVVFDVREEVFHLLLCSGLPLSSADAQKGIFSSHLLKVESNLFSTLDVKEMARLLFREVSEDIKRLF